jgi:hypothetical protein
MVSRTHAGIRRTLGTAYIGKAPALVDELKRMLGKLPGRARADICARLTALISSVGYRLLKGHCLPLGHRPGNQCGAKCRAGRELVALETIAKRRNYCVQHIETFRPRLHGAQKTHSSIWMAFGSEHPRIHAQAPGHAAVVIEFPERQ